MEPARPRAAGNGARARRLHGNSFSAAARRCSQSESLYWRDLALAHNPTGFFFADDGATEIRNFAVNLLERGLRKFQRRRKIFLKIIYVLLRAFDLIRRQRAQDSLHRFDFRHAMAKHHYVVSRLEAETNGVI